jgi:hypothetical protein
VAMELAASWKPFKKSKARATKMRKTVNQNIFLRVKERPRSPFGGSRASNHYGFSLRLGRSLRPCGRDFLSCHEPFNTTAARTSATSSHLSVAASSTS